MIGKRIPAQTTRNARVLRSVMTDVERLLWQALRSGQIDNWRFRRQYPVGRYIADFACIERKLIIELDGGQHQAQQAHDAQREAFLQAQGWRVIRFWNNEVLENMEGVLEVILHQLRIDPHPGLVCCSCSETIAL